MILRALFLRTVLRRPVRLAMTVAGVAVGVASVVATLLANRAAIASLDAGVEQVAGAARLEITRPGGLDVEVLGALRPLADDGLFVPVVDEVAQVPAWRDRVRVLGVDLLVDGDVRALAVDSGADDELAAERFDTLLLGRGVAVPRSLAEERGLALGDPLELLTSSRRERFEVAGIFDPPGFSSVWDRVLVVDVALAQEVFGRSASLDRIEVRPRHELDLDAFAQRIRAALPAGHQVEAPSARREEGRRMVRALEFNLTALAGISVLVGVVLVATALATSVVQRRYALALLRSLGASRAQLARSVLVEAAGIGLAGGVAGALLGWAGARGALEGVSASVASITSEALPGRIRFELFHLLLGAGLGLASACVAALLPLREALGTPPLQGLVAERPETLAGRRYGQRLALFAALLAVAWGLTRVPPLEDRPIFALGSALVLLSTLLVVAGPSIDLATRGRRALARAPRAAPLRVAQAALAAGRQRAAWAAGAVGTAVGLAVAMTTMIGSFRATVVDWTDQAMRSDLFVRPLPTAAGVPAGRIAPEVQRVAFELFGEHAVDSYQSADATFRGQRVQLAGVGMRAAQGRKALPFLDGRDAAVVLRAAREQRRAIVNEPFARRFGVGRGDRIELATRGGVIAPVVEGVFADYSSHTGLALVDRAWFAELLPDEVEPADARERLASALGGRYALDLVLNRELREEVLAVFDRTFAITTALQLVASVVAVIAVVTVLFALVDERRGELALVRVLGGTRAQLTGVVVAQAGILALAGAGGGGAVGLTVGWVLVKVVNLQSFGWTLRFLPPWGSIAVTMLAVVPAALAAGALPAWIAARRTPQEVLRDDG